MNRKIFIELCGWYGITAILAAYACVSFEVINSQHVLYQILNFTGAIGVIVVSVYKRVWQTVVLNIVWVAIAVIGLIRSVVY
ncbi:hypothetical protein EON76_02715 [bacterium]|nr:MAG: hypothetical protein EON76_02715 [bacterium]